MKVTEPLRRMQSRRRLVPARALRIKKKLAGPRSPPVIKVFLIAMATTTDGYWHESLRPSRYSEAWGPSLRARHLSLQRRELHWRERPAASLSSQVSSPFERVLRPW